MCTLGLEVFGVAIEDVDVLFLDVNVVEEVVPHEGMVALGVVHIEANVLVHVEGHHILEAQHSALVEFRQVLVESKGGTAGGAAEDKRTLRRGFKVNDSFGYIVGSPDRHFVIVFSNDYAHILLILIFICFIPISVSDRTILWPQLFLISIVANY